MARLLVRGFSQADVLCAVEVRGAPWIGWITDLSVMDPYYVLPALMTALAELRDHHIPSLDLAAHSGGGLRDTTRIAASSPEMWRDIFLWNRDNIVRFIDAYQASLQEFRRLIASGDAAGVEKAMERAKSEREKLNHRPPVNV